MHDELRFPAGLGTSFSACCCIIPTKASAFVCCWPWVKWPCGLPHYGAAGSLSARRISGFLGLHPDALRPPQGIHGNGRVRVEWNLTAFKLSRDFLHSSPKCSASMSYILQSLFAESFAFDIPGDAVQVSLSLERWSSRCRKLSAQQC